MSSAHPSTEHPSIASTSIAAKLGTRLVILAMIVTGVGIAAASIAIGAPSAGGAARVDALIGTGRLGASGDGGPASAAALASPAGVAVDGANDVIIADTGNCRIRVTPATDGTRFGILMRAHQIYGIAGSTCGLSGDRGRAINAQLSFPSDVALDVAGDVIVADTGNDRIRAIAAAPGHRFGVSMLTGHIYTIAGDGTHGFAGDRGPATRAQLAGPGGVAVDAAGDVYIADTNNCRVRELPAAAGTQFGITMKAGDIYTVAGNGTCDNAGDGHRATAAELCTPTDVAVDAAGNLVIADTGNRLLREVAATAGTNFGVAMTPGSIYTIAGSGTYNPYFGDGLPAVGDAQSLSYPTHIAIDAFGNLYIGDTYARAVREVPAVDASAFGMTLSADAVYTIAGAGPAESATAGGTAHDRLVYPAGVAVDASGTVYTADVGTNTVLALEGPPG